MLNVALVTWSGLPSLTEDDRLVRAALEHRGARVTATVWDDPSVDWSRFDRVVLRSTWDYHRNAERFLGWIDALPVPLQNPAPLVRWNSHKKYLSELGARGVNVVPTLFRSAAAEPPLFDPGYESGGSATALLNVIKPAISATAYRTKRVHRDDLERELATFDCDVLVQPFIPEVVERGEWSLIFFDGEYSHTVLKRAKEGDFRVQNDFGGTVTVLAPPRTLIEQARAILEAIDETPVYARVDGVEIDGNLMLMELELIEPVLFLGTHEPAADRFAEAILT
ncbi:MAG TPA: hypothetical protein VMU84_05785 [Thermoanaerobaculia bacterium]|nr:hypothetical protein [Thermoanaerobaculia bacterium]